MSRGSIERNVVTAFQGVKEKVKVAQLCLTLCDPMSYIVHAVLRPEHWSGNLFSSPGDPPNPEIESRSPALQADSVPAEPPGKPNVMMTFQGEEAGNTGIGQVMEARLGK